MDLDALIEHYFAAADPDAIDPAGRAAGIERLTIDFGVERDAGRRFALWALLYALDAAPDPATAFKHAAERRAAEAYARAAGRAGRA